MADREKNTGVNDWAIGRKYSMKKTNFQRPYV